MGTKTIHNTLMKAMSCQVLAVVKVSEALTKDCTLHVHHWLHSRRIAGALHHQAFLKALANHQ